MKNDLNFKKLFRTGLILAGLTLLFLSGCSTAEERTVTDIITGEEKGPHNREEALPGPDGEYEPIDISGVPMEGKIDIPECGDGFVSYNEKCDIGYPCASESEKCVSCQCMPADTPTHTECSNGGCIAVEGAALDQCADSEECRHMECVNGSCSTIPEPGEDACAQSEECRHKECQSGECVTVNEPGEDSCEQSRGECFHTVCIDKYQTCQKFNEPGEDECVVYADCLAPKERHTECRHGVCMTIEGPGEDQCSESEECNHYECVDKKCKIVSEPGSDTCEIYSADSDSCAPPKETEPVYTLRSAEMTFAHVAPGEYSEVYLSVITDPGAPAAATLTGPGVDDSATKRVIADENGQAYFTWRIVSYGPYTATGYIDGTNKFTRQIVVQ